MDGRLKTLSIHLLLALLATSFLAAVPLQAQTSSTPTRTPGLLVQPTDVIHPKGEFIYALGSTRFRSAMRVQSVRRGTWG
jgi:hypothetical protein